MAVYDDQKEQPKEQDVLTGSSKRTGSDPTKKPLDAADLRAAEQDGDTKPVDKAAKGEADKLGAGFTDNIPVLGQMNKAKRIANFFIGNKKRKAGTGAAVGGAVAGLTLLGFTSIGPIKAMFFMQNIDRAAFGAISQNTEELAENIMSRYLIRHVIPGMVDGQCVSTKIDRSCALVAQGNSQVSKLYNAWRDANLENKLATRHGIEIRRSGTGNNSRFYLRMPGITGDVDIGDITTIRNFNGNLFAEIDHPDRQKIRAAVRKGLNGETRFKNRVTYYQTARLLERKYGIKRCLVMCTTRDAWDDKKSSLTNKAHIAKVFMMQRIISPQSEAFSLLLECGLSGFDCADMGDAEQDGTRMTKYERNLASRLIQLRASIGTEDFNKLVEDSDRIRRDGLVAGLARKVLPDIMVRVTGKAIPIVGQVDLAIMMAHGAEKIGPALMAITYSLNAATAVASYAMMNTTVSEMMLGESDLDALGSVTALMNQDLEKDQGGAGAESSPLYDIINGGGTTVPVVSRTPVLFGSIANSTMQPVQAYQCNDPSVVPDPVCPEETFDDRSLSRLTSFVRGASSWTSVALATSAYAHLGDYWVDASNWVYDSLGQVIGQAIDILDIFGIQEWLADKLEPAIQAAATWFASYIVSMITDDPSGARMYNVTAAGAFISTRDLGLSMGGQVLDEADVLALLNEQEYYRSLEFESKPLYARLFDTTDNRSLASRFVMTMPSNASGAQGMIAGFLANPLGNSANQIASSITPKTTAATMSGFKALGIVPIGFKPTDAVFAPDIENYEEANNCSDPNNAKDWADAAPVDAPPSLRPGDVLARSQEETANLPSNATDLIGQHYTGQLMPTESNGCMLVSSVVSALGSEFDESFLPKDKAVVGSETATPGSVVPTGAWVNPMAGQKYKITSGYGPRDLFGYGFHYGTDLGATVGTPYTAAKDGVVTFVGVEDWGTRYIHIDHGDYITEYGHSYTDKDKCGASFCANGIFVTVGQKVKAGEVIGHVGAHGKVTGPHLHFNVRKPGIPRWQSYIDPEPFMREQGAPL